MNCQRTQCTIDAGEQVARTIYLGRMALKVSSQCSIFVLMLQLAESDSMSRQSPQQGPGFRDLSPYYHPVNWLPFFLS